MSRSPARWTGTQQRHGWSHPGEEAPWLAKTITLLQDDIDGSDANEIVRFAIDGTEYEIDLSERNANRFRESIAEFIGHARKVSGRRGRKAASSLGTDMSKAGQMREWLMEHGYDVSERGRIPDWLQQVYHDRH